MLKSLLGILLLFAQSVWASEGRMDDLLRKSVDDFYTLDLFQSPESLSSMGITDEQHRWDDVSVKALDEKLKVFRDRQRWLNSEIVYGELNEKNKLNFDLYMSHLEREIQTLELKDELYVIYGINNFTEKTITIMRDWNVIRNVKEAEAYIGRLKGIDERLGQFSERMERAALKNFLPPKFVYPPLIKVSTDILTGNPFDNNGSDSPLLDDFKKKITKAGIQGEDAKRLINQCENALMTDVKRGYGQLITFFRRMESLATDEDGLVKRPNGLAVYESFVHHHTTTNLTADEVHQIGLKEIKRIHAELDEARIKIGFNGNLDDFFHYLRTSKDFYLPNTDEGRSIYIKKAADLIETTKQVLPEYFSKFPNADVFVRKVEPFQEATAPTAFYYWPSVDGSRPGYYYLNMSDMNRLNTLKLNVLAIHEALPGHHMQVAMEMEMKDLPKFRTQFKMLAAYQEGWGMYAEHLGKEMGLYRDHWSDVGRLNMELWRAIRLVVDTGMHAKGWTRTEARKFAFENSPENEAEIYAEINRFVMWPGQATGYKIGMLKIMELRKKAESELGNKFDLKKFHDAVLKNGTVPLNLLEKQIDAWIESDR